MQRTIEAKSREITIIVTVKATVYSGRSSASPLLRGPDSSSGIDMD